MHVRHVLHVLHVALLLLLLRLLLLLLLLLVVLAHHRAYLLRRLGKTLALEGLVHFVRYVLDPAVPSSELRDVLPVQRGLPVLDLDPHIVLERRGVAGLLHLLERRDLLRVEVHVHEVRVAHLLSLHLALLHLLLLLLLMMLLLLLHTINLLLVALSELSLLNWIHHVLVLHVTQKLLSLHHLLEHLLLILHLGILPVHHAGILHRL